MSKLLIIWLLTLIYTLAFFGIPKLVERLGGAKGAFEAKPDFEADFRFAALLTLAVAVWPFTIGLCEPGSGKSIAWWTNSLSSVQGKWWKIPLGIIGLPFLAYCALETQACALSAAIALGILGNVMLWRYFFRLAAGAYGMPG